MKRVIQELNGMKLSVTGEEGEEDEWRLEARLAFKNSRADLWSNSQHCIHSLWLPETNSIRELHILEDWISEIPSPAQPFHVEYVKNCVVGHSLGQLGQRRRRDGLDDDERIKDPVDEEFFLEWASWSLVETDVENPSSCLPTPPAS